MSKYDQLPIMVDTKYPIPINIQLKEQIKYLISNQVLQPGDYLPTVNQLAEQLDINRNTINWVYTQLKDEGLILMHKGRRTQIANDEALKILTLNKDLNDIVVDSITKAIEKGFNFEQYMTSTVMNHYLFIKNIKKKSYLFIECKEHDHPFYYKEVKKHTGASVERVFLEDLNGKNENVMKNIESYSGIITTLNHADEVQEIFKEGRKPIFTIGATISTVKLMQVAQLKEGAKAAFICLGNKGGQWLAKKVEEAGINHIHTVSGGVDSNLNHVVETADHIYASEAVYEQVKSLVPFKTHLLPLKLEDTSEKILKDLRVH